MPYKLTGSEAPANTIASYFSNQKTLRVVHKGTTPTALLTVGENARPVTLLINAVANATTLMTLSSGNTANLATGQRVMGSSNLSVVNTNVSSEIVTIVGPSSFTVNVDIIIADGTCTVYAADAVRTITLNPNTEFVIDKGRTDVLHSNNTVDVLATPVSFRG